MATISKTLALTLANGDTISYHLERRPRRTVGLKITNNGLIVHAPRHILEFQLKKILQEKSNWIQNKLEARKKNYVPPLVWQQGELLQFLGNPITLHLVIDTKNRQPQFNHDSLLIQSPEIAQPIFVQRKVVQWYKKQAFTDFGRRLEILAAKLGVPTPALQLSNAQSRWGSCNSRGVIRLNWRLLQAPPHIINYVICHELAHLKEMNHSAKFWAVVSNLYPNYKQAEEALKLLSPQLHRL